jgi:hypothetical protein
MPTARRFAIAVALGMSGSLGPSSAAAAEPTCDAGAVCPDEDGDGFAACGCPWSGVPCDCDDADKTVFPGAPETCDARNDHNCSGVTADRCPAREGCFQGACVPECIPLDDFGCPGGSSFAREADGGRCLCAPQDCTVFGCPSGNVCDDDKRCVPRCHPGVVCPHGQICRGFGCVDPCEAVTCPAGAACDRGRCIPSCSCDEKASCPAGTTCDLTMAVPSCVDSKCMGVQCASGEHCTSGACVDDCDGVSCPPKTVCRKTSVNGRPSRGACIDLCSPDPCSPGTACDWQTGGCKPIPLPEGGLALPPASSVEVDPLDVAGAGWVCVCTASGLERVSAFGGVGSAMGWAVMTVVRRRRRRPPRV